MKVLVFPKDANPYQELLYSEMRMLGVRITYLGVLTPFHGLNITLLPLETVVRRLFGADLVHIHWVAPFTLPGSRRFYFMRRISQRWFGLWLNVTVRFGAGVVWTAHNILPHEPVFADDIAARAVLARVSDLVIVHSVEARKGLAEIGATPRKVVVIPHGPFNALRPNCGAIAPTTEFDSFRFLFIGRVKKYKGVEELLDAFIRLPPELKVHLTIAGQCSERDLLDVLSSVMDNPRISVHVGPERLSDADMVAHLAEAHAVVLPFRTITTSGSAVLAISHGKPIILPSAASMIDIPESAAIRYDGTQDGLTRTLASTASMSAVELATMSDAAIRHAYRISWKEIAMRTIAEMSHLSD